MGLFGRGKPGKGEIRSTKAGRVLADAKRDVAKPEATVTNINKNRGQRNSGGKK